MNSFLVNAAQPIALLGFLGQFLFFSRFLVQWSATEREKKTVVPVSFWYLSILGAVFTLIYAFYRRDPVFTLAQSLAIVIYLRNLQIHYRSRDHLG